VQKQVRCQWLTLVILATQEAEIRRILVRRFAWTNSLQDPISKKPIAKRGLVEWLKVEALSSNPSATKERKKESTEAEGKMQ
jgi:hypothetical protein